MSQGMKLLSLLFPHPSPVEHLIPVRNASFSPYSNSTGVHCGEGVGSSVGREGEPWGGRGSRVEREGVGAVWGGREGGTFLLLGLFANHRDTTWL